MALSALICCDLGDLAGFSLLGRVAMLAKCHTPHYFVTSLPPSDILLLSRPDQAWSLKSPLDIAQINAPSQLLSPTSPVPPSYHTILSHSLILLGRNLPFISLPTHPTPVQVWRRPHRKPGEKSSVERNLPYSRAETELHLHCWVEVLTWKLSRTRTLCRLFLMLFQIVFSPSILPAIFGLHLLTHPHSRRMCLHALTHTFMLQLLF